MMKPVGLFFWSFPGGFAGLEIVRARGAGKQQGPLAAIL
jgi:hypothetical protein